MPSSSSLASSNDDGEAPSAVALGHTSPVPAVGLQQEELDLSDTGSVPSSRGDAQGEHAWHRVVGRATRCICIWPQQLGLSTPQLYDILLRFEDRVLIRKIVRVFQRRTRRLRFDVFVPDSDLEAAFDLVTDLAADERWHVKVHVPYRQRLAQHRVAPPPPSVASRTLRIATFNINSFLPHKFDLYSLATRESWDVILLQETLVDAERLDSVRLPGYHSVAGPKTANAAHRGTAVMVRRSLVAVPIVATANMTAVRVFSGTQQLIVVSTYVPRASGATAAANRAVLSQLQTSVLELRAQYADVPLVVGGDFNQKAHDLDATLASWPVPMQRVPVTGSGVTWHTPLARGQPPPRRSERLRARAQAAPVGPAAAAPAAPARPPRRQARWSDIDHLLVSQPHLAGFTKARVNRRADCSDHFAVVASLKMAELPQVAAPQHRTRVRIDAAKLLAADRANIFGNNRFASLEEEWLAEGDLSGPAPAPAGAAADVVATVTERLERRAEAFEAACTDVIRDLGLERADRPPKKLDVLSRVTHRAIADRARMSATLSHQASVTDEQVAEYNALVRRAKDLVRRDRERAWLRLLYKLTKFRRAGDWGGVWRLLRSLGRRGRFGPALSSPLVADDGTLQTTLDGRLEVLRAYFARLATDSSGLSQDAAYWAQLFESSRDLPLSAGAHRVDSVLSHGFRTVDPARAPELAAVNRPVTYLEVVATLESMATRKAPGPSGLTVDFFRVVLDSRDADNNVVPCPLGQLLFSLVHDMIAHGFVCHSQRLAHLVTLYKGKGDPTNPGDYRGISLIDSGLKVAMALVSRRLNTALENCRLLDPVQGGFRPGEEAIGQVVALYEICSRRLDSSPADSTVLAFLDFAKAFDVVSHAGLLRKLELFGFSGMVMDFLRGVYAASSIAVAIPSRTSAPFPLERGVRQGCPASPSLFDVYINDMATSLAGHGIFVPKVVPSRGAIAGLWFADDVALLAATSPIMRELLALAQAWARRNAMSFGVSKCGLMVVGKPLLASHRKAAKALAEAGLTLQDTPVPVVQSYRYLGIEFNSALDLCLIGAARAESVRKALFAWLPVLSNKSVPLSYRVTVFRSTVMGVARYGGELLGLESRAIVPIQRWLNKGLRVLLGATMNSRRCSAEVLMLEFAVPDLFSLMSGARVRAFLKWEQQPTIIGELIKSFSRRYAPKSTSWAYRTFRWLAKNAAAYEASVSRGDGELTPTRGMSPADHGRAVARWLHTKMIRQLVGRTKCSKTLAFYVSAEFVHTRRFIDVSAHWPRWAQGVSLLASARVGAYTTGRFLANAGILPAEYKEECPFCGVGVPDTIGHVLVECSSWDDERDRFLAALLASVEALGVEGASATSVVLMGGSSDGLALDGWLGAGLKRAAGDGQGPDQELNFDFFDDDNNNNNNNTNSGHGSNTGRFANESRGGRGGSRFSRGSSGGASSDAPDGPQGGPPPFLAVAMFLQSIAARRRVRFGALAQRAEAHLGMASLDSEDDADDVSDSGSADFS